MLDFIDLIQQKPQLIAVYLSYVLFLWFLFIFIGCFLNKPYCKSRYIRSSLVMLLVWFFYCLCFVFSLFDDMTYNDNIRLIILVDSVTALILISNQFISRYSCKIALTIAFAVLCHCMILLHKSTDLSEIVMLTVGFYGYYDELIAAVGVLQLLVTFNDGFASAIKGFSRPFRKSKIYLLRSYGCCVHYIQSCNIFFKQEPSEKRT